MNYDTALENKLPILQAETEGAPASAYAESTDRQLVDRVLAGDGAAFECIFDRHKRRIAVIAGRFFRNPAEVDEIIQITFTTAYFELKGFRGLHDHSLRSWLGRIAANACLNRLKTPAARLDGLTAELPDHEREAISADLKGKSAEELVTQRDLLEKLLNTLSADDRALLQMLHAQEMSVAEIAAAFGWSRAKVKVRAFRARRALNRLLKRLL